jgi:hypothetical protein
MTGLSTVELSLRIGQGFPTAAPAYLMRALRRVEVTQQDSAPCGFQLTFLTEIASAGSVFDIVADPLLVPFNRVVLRAAVNGVPVTLMDGFITHQQFAPGNGPDDSQFVVTGEDISVVMDLVDYSREFPAMPDAATVAEVLAPWLALGIAPSIIPSPTSLVPIDYVPQQAETDRALLQRLAQANGNVFYISPTDVLFVNEAYWGPPPRFTPPTAVIDVAVGAASTADSFSAQYNALAPETFFGESTETLIEPYEPIPIATFASTRFPPLAAVPALTQNPLFSRHTLWRDDQLDPVRAVLTAQSRTNVSTDEVVSVNCSFAPARLGTVVSAPGVVGVRGTGQSYDGLYYLKSATHQISLLADTGWDYTQQLAMTREGTGTTTPVLKAS